MIKPITPQEVNTAKGKAIPDYIIEIINNLIAKNWDGEQSIVKQDEIITAITTSTNITREEIFREKFLNIESLYRACGWNVVYDKPGFTETYPATFTFVIPF